MNHTPRIPIHRLPVELTTQIFLYCLPLETKDRRPSGKLAPLLLLHVCSEWRTIALSISRLWDTFSIVVESHEKVNVKGYGQAAEYWFAQAGDYASLTLKIDACDPPRNEHEIANDLLKEVVVPHAQRLRRLGLWFQHYCDVPVLWQREGIPDIDGSFEQLEHLSLSFDDYPDEVYTVTAFENAPRLRTVEIRNATLLGSLEISLPWSQLTSLNISCIHVSLWITMLPQCTNLEQGTFTFLEVDPEDPDSLPPASCVTMPNLVDLTVCFSDRSGPYIFNGFYFPALVNFGLLVRFTFGLFSWSNPQHLYQQLRYITSLSLSDNIPALDIIELLRHTPQVTHFDVRMEDDHGLLLSALRTTLDSEVLLPKLEKISIRTPWKKQTPVFSVVSFVHMIVSRSGNRRPRSVTSLRLVEPVSPPVPNNFRERVQALTESLGEDPGLPAITYRSGY
ncbi:hypothetical protein Hypma_005139 [Hypsizygus marmoreus]|uniref:Uncharacterized protein n=1 Tax=Hypsizygus marmoreus TaxID=39966 RepID=A0A369JZ29_HYPMA|nr:hypothetical protein Hypma_005139 [Hypsizygus marmoreus]